MGIPAYFIHIVKNYPKIIKKYLKNMMIVNNLYLDCNSIIYDSLRAFKITPSSPDLIKQVIVKIEEYIVNIKPLNNVIIAFDGCCPISKMEQQRNRRYKTVLNPFASTSENKFNTTCLTPGTDFMNLLDESVSNYFSKRINNNLNIIVSTSSIPGEGEHKIFQYIRNNPEEHNDNNTVIFGLDADLIMLSINHLKLCPNIYLYRETPEFIKSIDSSLDPNELYVLDIAELSKSTMIPYNDYIFICFFLGNDFLPHFPALNIRTGGIDKLTNAYKATIKEGESLTNGKTIYWKNVRKLIAFLANQEELFIKNETKSRDRREKTFYPNNTLEEKMKKFDALPQTEREMEKFIYPFKEGWQYRYYKTLFKTENTEERVKQICINYLEGIEWTNKYYSIDCPDWRWRYKYHYPPLLQDLIRYIPYFETDFIKDKQPNPVSTLTQLCYVLPRESLQFLPEKVRKNLLENYSHLYPEKVDFVWCYCKYFWESHAELPEMDEILDI
jgi:5'-3' exonuclease